MGTVKCQDCGLLALYNMEHEIYEAPLSFRTTGGFPRNGPGRSPQSWLACAMRQFPLVKDGDWESRSNTLALAVITEERECPKFFPWRQGFSPKEHIQMLYSEESLKRQEEWQKQMAADRRAWEIEVSRERQAWEAQQRAEDRKWRIIFSFVAAIGGALITYYMATILGISRHGTPVTFP